MLTSWQQKFQKSFEAYPKLFTQLTSQQQSQLSDLLALVEQSGLLNEKNLGNLLSWSINYYLDELVYLIEKLAEFHCLNQSTFDYLFAKHSLSELKASIYTLADRELLTTETITFLFSTPDFCSKAQFITRASMAMVPFESIKKFLSQHIDMNGLSRAIALFDLSGLPYSEEHFNEFHIVARVFGNTLCQTIFDARLRSYSDYSEPSEPVNSRVAVTILSELGALSSQEERVAFFFDFFAELRPFPCSQRDLVDVDVADEVTKVLRSYCKSAIATVDSQQDYLRVRKMISELQNTGGNKLVFDDVKYRIASAIESADLCSIRNYKTLMDEVRQALMTPQRDLESFTKEFQSTKGYLRTVSAEMRRQSPIIMQPLNESSDKDASNDDASKRPRVTDL